MDKQRTVAIYIRVATESKEMVEELRNQLQYFIEILDEHPKWTLHKLYMEAGITNSAAHKKEQFHQMMKDANDGVFDLIITKDVSRFARNTVDTLEQTRKLKKLGVDVWFTDDDIYTFCDPKEVRDELKAALLLQMEREKEREVERIKNELSRINNLRKSILEEKAE